MFCLWWFWTCLLLLFFFLAISRNREIKRKENMLCEPDFFFYYIRPVTSFRLSVKLPLIIPIIPSFNGLSKVHPALITLNVSTFPTYVQIQITVISIISQMSPNLQGWVFCGKNRRKKNRTRNGAERVNIFFTIILTPNVYFVFLVSFLYDPLALTSHMIPFLNT